MFTRLYLHIPFCLRKCGYCAFNSQKIGRFDLESYVEHMLSEMLLVTPPARKLDSIYFGGGTPSLLKAGQLERLIQRGDDLFCLAANCEITLEANPGTVDPATLSAFKSSGVNRLSLGVQSFNDNFLEILGRPHNADQARHAFNDARKAGFTNIGIDLMNSLPSQNSRDWETDLQQVIRLSPEHISVYGLTVEEGTPFYHRYPDGCPEIPDEDISADMFEMADDLLTEAGYEHYEIANYARSGYRSRHNSGYWQRDGYQGVGVGAHSFFKDGNGVRFSNVSSLREYAGALRYGRLPVLEKHRLTTDDATEEYIFLGLRLAEGIKFRAFEQEFGRSFFEIYGTITDELVKAGLLRQEEDSLRLTRRGMLLSNQVFNRFV